MCLREQQKASKWKSDVHDTPNSINVCIYVVQAILELKQFSILKNQQPVFYLPILNDIF